ncbi:uncharacterized protein TNCV_4397211 [Trichonephila clavipes]|nr:uncharacterized protein TNCV_4397211 [Trichonephila clavipes]
MKAKGIVDRNFDRHDDVLHHVVELASLSLKFHITPKHIWSLDKFITVLSFIFIINSTNYWVAWWSEHRTPDRKAWVLCPMPPNTLRVHMEYVLVKSVGPKVLWAESRVQGSGEHFPPFQTHGKIVEVEIVGVALYRSFGEFTELIRTVTCMMLKAYENDRRTSSPLPG